MEKTIFKFGLFLTLVLTTATFYSCEKNDAKDDNGKASMINATNVINGSSDIAFVKAETFWYTWENDQFESGTHTLAETQFKNNGFTLELPATVPDEYLEVIGNGEEIEGITISDKTAKTLVLEGFIAYDIDNNAIGSLAYTNADPSVEEENISGIAWFYVEKKLTVNGEYIDVDVNDYYNEEYIIKYNNLTLKKGWNTCYVTSTYSYDQATEKETRTTVVSSQKPSGITLNWYYSGYNYEEYKASLKSAKSISKIKSIFHNKK